MDLTLLCSALLSSRTLCFGELRSENSATQKIQRRSENTREFLSRDKFNWYNFVFCWLLMSREKLRQVEI